MNEQLSALIDNELTLDEAEHLLSALQAPGSASEAWQSYHLIGDAMRGARPLSADFKQNLMQKIEQEPTVLSPNAALTKTSNAAQPAKSKLPTAWAMAASVAGLMAVGWALLQTQMINQTANTPMALAPTTANTQVAQTKDSQTQVAQATVAKPKVETSKASQSNQAGQSQAVETQVAQLDATQVDAAQAYAEPVVPTEYLMAHQATAPTSSAYYIQTASYSQ